MKITAQSLFNKVKKHLLTQNKKSLLAKGDGTCAYRGENGLRCAIGKLITNKEYHKDMEENSLAWLLSNDKFPSLNRFAPHIALLGALQYVHDGNPPKEWKDRLKQIAVEFNLKFNPPKKK